MVGGPSVALLRDMRTLFDAGTVAGLSDRQLLERFTSGGDGSSEAAFEVLVRRHGPMVLRVCRNVLRDWNDAEDAFQATFVILARRCGSIRRRDSVESWLFGVAWRVAARARVEAARRRAVERRGAAEAESALGPPGDEETDRLELGPIVQEEVRRLPEKYRAAVVLCYWEGRTQEQAAAQLGCPLGTVRSRLARARDLLRRRLARRGVAPLAGIGGSGFDLASIAPIPAAVPDSWVAATLKAISHAVTGGGPATVGTASACVGLLVRSVLRRMVVMRVKTIAIGLSFLAMGAAGVIVAAPQAGLDRNSSAAAKGSRAGQARERESAATTGTMTKGRQPALRALDDYVIEPPDVILVEVLEALPGRPISGERLVRPDGKISLGFYGEVYVAGLTLVEAKEKIVQHLRKYLSDHTLGLTDRDDVQNVDGDIPRGKLRDTDRVFVVVTQINSKNYYVLGDIRNPGRYPIRGPETVLDGNLSAGLLRPVAATRIRLVRPAPPGACCEQSLPVDLAAITGGRDFTTNYQLIPGDRLIVTTGPDSAADDGKPVDVRPTAAAGASSTAAHLTGRRDPAVPARPLDVEFPRRDESDDVRTAIRDLERRTAVVERKLDRVIDALEKRER